MSRAIDVIGRNLVWIGESAGLQQVKTQLKEVADTDLPVLVIGEPGTGRRLAVRTVHALSGRRDNAFVEVNCGTLHPARAKSVFLGREGAFEQAKGGVLFLDDIDGLSPGSQVRLHHILRDLCIERSGDAQSTPIDVRVIAATGQDLSRRVKAERFHAELYYHLNLFPVKLPPLRERKEDIPLLAVHFAERCALLMGLKAPGLRPESIAALQAHDWPGNVWELRRILERAVVLSGGGEIRPEHLVVQDFLVDSEGEISGPQEASHLFGLRLAAFGGRPELN